MVYGRVIGNELRDVPPEYLPIWGQRWSGYRTPHGPSPFSTRVFSADRMSEMGPPLTSPTQFELALTEDDEAEDTSSESSQFRSFFLSSALSSQADVTGLTFRPEAPVPRSIYSSNNPRDGPQILHRGTEHPSPQRSMQFDTMSLPRRQSEHSGIQHSASEPTLHTLVLYHGIPTQGNHEKPQNDCTLWNMDRTSISFQLQDGHSHSNGQLQHTMSPHSISEWQFADAYTQPLASPVQLNPSPYLGNSRPLLPYQPDDRISFIPIPPQSSFHRFTIPLPLEDVAVYPSRAYDPNVRRQHPNLPSSWPLQNSAPPPGSGTSYHLVPDRHGEPTHPEGFS